MQIEHTHWTDEDIKSCTDAGCKTDFLFIPDAGPYQPEFGMTIGWNEPRKFWKPFVVIFCWHWKVQIGWLF